MRVILDTGVIVSGFISPHGVPAQILARWSAGDFTLLYSPAILEELEDVLQRVWLRQRLANVPDRIPAFLTAIKLLGELILGYTNVAGAVRDPFDEMFLACAVLGSADYLVSGDKDLLSLNGYEKTRILTPARFLSILQSEP